MNKKSFLIRTREQKFIPAFFPEELLRDRIRE
jgi:hypothetical protein